MATIIFGIVAVILTTLIIITMCRLGKLETYYSDLLNDLLKTNGNVSEYKQRRTFPKHCKNQKSIDDIKDGDLFKIKKQIREHDEMISKIGKVVFTPITNPADETNCESNSATSAEEAAVEEETPVSEDKVKSERSPYSPEVRKMAEDFIKAEYGKSSYKVMSNLLNIPVTTVKRWTKKLIEKGEIAKQ